MAHPNYTPAERVEAANAIGIHEQYLYQIINGHRTPSATLARKIAAHDKRFSLKELRPDWASYWPELADVKV